MPNAQHQYQKLSPDYKIPPASSEDPAYYHHTTFSVSYPTDMKTFYKWLKDLGPARRTLVKSVQFNTAEAPSSCPERDVPTQPVVAYEETLGEQAGNRLKRMRADMRSYALNLDYAVLITDTGDVVEGDVPVYVMYLPKFGRSVFVPRRLGGEDLQG